MKFIMKYIKPLIIPAATLLLLLILYAGGYVVLPEGIGDGIPSISKGWSAVATGIGTSDSGDVRIDLTLRNETGDWSAMQAIPGKAAVLTDKDGKSIDCPVVFVGTGGHRLAPGFQLRGFMGGKKSELVIQMIYVECPSANISPGSKLSIKYSVEGLIRKPDVKITALNDVVLTLNGITRTERGLQFTWQTFNPGEYPTYVHIGNPPVLGANGILYGLYQSPDIASVPIIPAGKSAEWTTEVAVPEDVKGLYIMLSVESGKQRLFMNYCLDITDK